MQGWGWFSLASFFTDAGRVSVRARRTELAGGEGVEGAEAGGEFGSGEAAFAVEAAEKIGGGGFPFLRVAFHTTGKCYFQEFLGSSQEPG